MALRAPAAARMQFGPPDNRVVRARVKTARCQRHSCVWAWAGLLGLLFCTADAGSVPLYFPGQLTVPVLETTNAVIDHDLDGDGQIDLVAGRDDGYLAFVQNTGFGQYRVTGYYFLGGQVVDLLMTPYAGLGEALAVLTRNPDRLALLAYVGGLEVFQLLISVDLDEDPGQMVSGPLAASGQPALAVTLPGIDRWLLVQQEAAGWQIVQTIASGDHPAAIAWLDLDQDQVPEVVTADNGYLSRCLSLYRRDPEGRYQLTEQIPAPGNPLAFCVYDQDGDLQPEVFVSYEDSAYVSIFQAQSGSLAEMTRVDLPIPIDGVLAAPVFGGTSGMWCWNRDRGVIFYHRLQQGQWIPRESYFSGGRATDVIFTDLNGDLLKDLAVANGQAGSLALLFGNNAPSFRAYLAALLPEAPTGAQLWDEDFDGHLDYVVASFGASTLEFLRGDGHGHLRADPAPLALNNPPRDLAAFRADADTLLDLAVVQPTANRVLILRRLPGGGYTAAGSVPTGTSPFAVRPADLDGDGDFDLVVGNEGSDDISFAANAGDGTFTVTGSMPLSVSLQDVVTADLDGDDLPDLIFSAGQTAVGTSKNLGNLIFGQLRFYLIGNGPASLAAVDLDDDLDLDIVVAKETDQSLAILENTGHGILTVRFLDISLGSRPGRLSAADVDLNGYADIVAMLPEDRKVAVVQNNGGWIFSPPARFVTALEPYEADIGDLNEDAVPDLVTMDRSLELALIMLNVEPNPVPVQSAALAAFCHPGGIELQYRIPVGPTPDLEAWTGSGWTVLARGAQTRHGVITGQGDPWILDLATADLVPAGIRPDAEDCWSFRLQLAAPDSTLAKATLPTTCGQSLPPAETALLSLAAPQPNPFNPSVRVSFELARPTRVVATVHDLAGCKVADVADRWFAAGWHDLWWNGQGRQGPAATGNYLLVVRADGRQISRKLTLLK